MWLKLKDLNSKYEAAQSQHEKLHKKISDHRKTFRLINKGKYSVEELKDIAFSMNHQISEKNAQIKYLKDRMRQMQEALNNFTRGKNNFYKRCQ